MTMDIKRIVAQIEKSDLFCKEDAIWWLNRLHAQLYVNNGLNDSLSTHTIKNLAQLEIDYELFSEQVRKTKEEIRKKKPSFLQKLKTHKPKLVWEKRQPIGGIYKGEK